VSLTTTADEEEDNEEGKNKDKNPSCEKQEIQQPRHLERFIVKSIKNRSEWVEGLSEGWSHKEEGEHAEG
jgi:hypothetical protein